MARIGHGLHIFYSKASSVVSDRFKDRHGKNCFVHIALALTFSSIQPVLKTPAQTANGTMTLTDLRQGLPDRVWM
jgi:hypothetical protein